MGGNDVSDVVDGNVASKVEDVGDNGGMTCEGEVSARGWYESMRGWCGKLLWYGSLRGWHGIL